MSNDIEHRAFWGCQGRGGINSIEFSDEVVVIPFKYDKPWIKINRKRPYRDGHLLDAFNYCNPDFNPTWTL